jgi:hypothetical protein
LRSGGAGNRKSPGECPYRVFGRTRFQLTEMGWAALVELM